MVGGHLQAHTRQGNVRFFLFKVRELCDVSEKMKLCKNVKKKKKCLENITFQPDEARMFGPGVFIKFVALSIFTRLPKNLTLTIVILNKLRCHAQIFSQSDFLVQVGHTNSYTG